MNFMKTVEKVKEIKNEEIISGNDIEKLNMLLAFLEKKSLIIIEEGKLKITQLGTKFLFL